MRNLLDEDGPDTVRLSEAQARAVSMTALAKCGYDAAGATIITDQLVDNALCGYRFAQEGRDRAAPKRRAFRDILSSRARAGHNRQLCRIQDS